MQNWKFYAGAAGVAAAGGWFLYRMSQRSKLARMLSDHPEMGSLGDPSEVASREIGLFDTTTADEVYTRLQLKLFRPPIPGLTVGIPASAAATVEKVASKVVAYEPSGMATEAYEKLKGWLV